MNNTIILICCLIAVVVSIAANFIWKFNLGFMSMAFAFLIGCLMQGSKAAAVFGYWPDNLIFFLLASVLFFGYARENGTLEAFGNKILWVFRNNINLMDWVLFLSAFTLSLLGAGGGTVVLLAPIGFSICMQIGMDPLLVVAAVDFGYHCGNLNPWTGSGAVVYSLIQANGLDDIAALSIYMKSYVTLILMQILMVAVIHLYFRFKKKKSAVNGIKIVIEKPASFTPFQRKTFILIIAAFLLMVLPNIINSFISAAGGHAGTLFKNFVKLCSPQAVLVIFAMLANIMNLGDTKKVLNKLPMNTVFIIAGISFIMEIAKGAGLIELISGAFGTQIPTFVAAGMMCLLAAFMSFFASANSVVLPLLFPMIPGIALATGINPLILYAAAQIGAVSTPVSPFSTAGSQLVALAPAELGESMIKRQLVLAILMALFCSVLCLAGFTNIFAF